MPLGELKTDWGGVGGQESPFSDEEVQVITLERCRAPLDLPSPGIRVLPGLQVAVVLLRVAERDQDQLCHHWSWQCWEPQEAAEHREFFFCALT